jgi:hypothetical protein
MGQNKHVKLPIAGHSWVISANMYCSLATKVRLWKLSIDFSGEKKDRKLKQ